MGDTGIEGAAGEWIIHMLFHNLRKLGRVTPPKSIGVA